MQNKWFAIVNVKDTVRAYKLYNQNMTIFYYIFCSAGLFATKLGLIVQHHEPECSVGKKRDYCVQGQGHSKGSKC